MQQLTLPGISKANLPHEARLRRTPTWRRCRECGQGDMFLPELWKALGLGVSRDLNVMYIDDRSTVIGIPNLSSESYEREIRKVIEDLHY